MDRPDYVDLDIYQSADEHIDDDDAFVTKMSLTAQNNWSAVLENLAEDYYYAKLVEPIEGYTTANDQIVSMILPEDKDGLLWKESDFYNHFGSKNFYSAFVFNNFITEGADVESGLAVAGNLHSDTDFSLGLPASRNAQWDWFNPEYDVGLPIMPHNPRLLVGNEINVPRGIHVIGGNLTMKDNTKVSPKTRFIKEWYYLGAGVYDSSIPPSEFEGIQYSPYNDGHKNYSDIKQVDTAKFDTFFAKAESSLKSLSQSYKNLVNNDITLVLNIVPDVSGNISLTPQLPNEVVDYSGYDCLVYNVKVAHTNTYAPQLNLPINEGGIWNINVIVHLEFEGMVIINVLPDNVDTRNFIDSTTKINGLDYLPNTNEPTIQGRFFEMASGYSDQIIWNFPDSDLSTIKMKAYGAIGTQLSPYNNFIASV